MSPKATEFIEKLLMDLRKDPDVNPETGIAVVIQVARQLGFDVQDTRECMETLRREFGKGSQMWSAMVVAQLRNIPGVGEGTIREIGRS